jgi:crotonobetainyl-CoA:carnitine CoA-transferase CaiB-like acyl-CoA transferase
MSSAFVWLNRGKESVQLDLKSDDGAAALDQLLASADVLVANLSSRALANLGVTAEQLASRHPMLIVCTISGYDPAGPRAERKAYDALIQAESGLMALTGTAGAPAKVGISVADIAAGSAAYSGVLAALRHRDRTGTALPVHVSLFGALTEWMGYPLYYTMYGGAAPVPVGTSHPTIAPYGSVTCADGIRLFLAVQNEREWRGFCVDVLRDPALFDDPKLASNAQRVANRHVLDDVVERGFRQISGTEAERRLDAAQIAWARFNAVEGLADHPELRRSGAWLETGTPAGPVRTLAPLAAPGGQYRRGGAVPALGEQTDAVLAELAGQRRKESA